MSHKRLNPQMLRQNSYNLISYKSQVYVFYYNQEQKIKLYAINYIYYYIYNIYSNLYSAFDSDGAAFATQNLFADYKE